VTPPAGAPALEELLDRADADRLTGRGESATALYESAYELARQNGDASASARAALGMAAGQLWGFHPGKLPVALHEAYLATEPGATRARLAAALARCWAYSGEPARAVPFADQAVHLATDSGDQVVLADALDAALAAHWGPDDLDRRRSLAGRLADVTAYLVDVDARMQAHLWGVTVALETMDMSRLHRQVRALESLASESPRAQFFAASRRLMVDVMEARLDTAPRLIQLARDASEKTAIPDADAVLHSMAGYSALFSGDVATCATEAEVFEEYGVREGNRAICAEAIMMWIGAGDLDRALALLGQAGVGQLDEIPRDADWLLTMQLVLEGALATGSEDVAAEVAGQLVPYENRAVVNAGGVMFHGVTDDPLSRAAELRGDEQEARRLRTRALATYRRIGATWWYDRLAGGTRTSRRTSSERMCLHPEASGLWLVGREGAAQRIPELRGLCHLHALIRRAGVDVRAVDLVGLQAGTAGAAPNATDLGEIIDDTARAAYRQRLMDLDEELAEADEWSDTGRLALLSEEREALMAELRAASGLGGRSRHTGSTDERARVAVRKAVVAAIERIEAIDPALARLLRDRVHTGTYCRYDDDPGRPVAWLLDPLTLP